MTNIRADLAAYAPGVAETASRFEREQILTRISHITFGVLKVAQALGDRQALLDRGRRVLRADPDHVPQDVAHIASMVPGRNG